MLTRQKIVLSLLEQSNKPLSPIKFVKIMFLFRQETRLGDNLSFYDFVPYKRGPFSFTLYRDLWHLRQNGYINPEEKSVSLTVRALALTKEKTQELSSSIRSAVAYVLDQYGRLSQQEIIKNVYSRYPWFALNSELPERKFASVQQPEQATTAVYTAGYEGRSVDGFFNDLLRQGIKAVIDVRANPISRKYGFSGSRFREICNKLGLQYRHIPTLGISSRERAGLSSFDSYQRLLNRYARSMLPQRSSEIEELGKFMCQEPSVLVCVEKDIRCCHRGRGQVRRSPC